ncbi:MAG: hypothetical protein E7029_07115 [Planctomycetaceae bacterium]|nr:hypothetical protein [Planctomycetaceae bacterium]
MKSNKNRKLHLESLENRVMLSVNPVLALQSVSPSGTQAVFGTQTLELEGGQTSDEIRIDTQGLSTLSIFLTSENAANAELRAGGNTLQISGKNAVSLNVEYLDSITFTLKNYSAQADTFTLFVGSFCEMENEMVNGRKNDSLMDTDSVQALQFTRITAQGTTSSSGKLQRSVTFGQLGENVDSAADRIDSYSFTASGGTADIQLHSISGTDMTVELYDSSRKLLAVGTNADDFTTVLSSVALTAQTEYFIQVKLLDSASEKVSPYALTVTENCTAGNDGLTPSPIVNDLGAVGVGIGKTEGTENTAESVLTQFAGESIRAFAVNGNRMAVVTFTRTDGVYTSAVLRLLEYQNSQWSEIASKQFNASSSDVDLETFGTVLAVCGDQVLAGDPENSSVLCFTQNGDVLESVSITAPGLTANSALGTDMLLTEEWAFISASKNSTNGVDSGSVFVFKKTASGWAHSQTISGTTGAEFGSKLAWDTVGKRFCAASAGSTQKLGIYEYSGSSWTLSSQIKASDLGSVFSAGTISDLARSLAFDDASLAVACKVNGTNCVRVYQWMQSESGSSWNPAAELVSDAMVHDFGASVSLQGNQLAVSSPTALNGSLENTGIVYLYRRTSSEEGTDWSLLQTLQYDENGAFGRSAVLSQNRLDVWDSINQQIRTLTNFADIDRWQLNLTSTNEVTLELMAQTPNSTLPVLEITAPDGTAVSVIPTTSSVGGNYALAQYRFTPSTVGKYEISLCSANSTSTPYTLNVLSGDYVPDPDSTAFVSVQANELIVEYAQQILVSGVEDAAAKLGAYDLEFKTILDGNRIVWTVPANVPNGTWDLTVSGLESVRGTEIAPLTVSCTYEGILFVPMSPSTVPGSSVQQGNAVFSITDTSEPLRIAIPCSSAAELEDLDFQVKASSDAMQLEISEPVYDAQLNACVLTITSQTAGNVSIRAALHASLSSADGTGDSLTFPSQGSAAFLETALVGSLAAGQTKEVTITLSSGEEVNFLLADSAGNQLKLELCTETDPGRTVIAQGTVQGSKLNGTRITGLKNTSGETVTYTLILTNSATSGTPAVDFELSALRNAVYESEVNDHAGMELRDTTVVSNISQKETVLPTEIPLPSLTTEQLTSFGVQTVISGDHAVISGADYAAVYQLKAGSWIPLQVISLTGNASIQSIALDGETLILGTSESVQVYALDAASGRWNFRETLTLPESFSARESKSLGYSMALCGDTLLVSAPFASDADGKLPQCGSAFLFTKDQETGSWEFTQQIRSASASVLSGFGYDVAMDSDTMAIFSLSNTLDQNSILSIWQKSGAVWLETAVLEAPKHSSYFTDPNLQLSQGHIFISSLDSQIFNYTQLGGAWKLAQTITPGNLLQITDLSISETSGLRLAAAIAVDTNTSFIQEYAYTGEGWTMMHTNTLSTPVTSIALGAEVSLAAMGIVSNEQTSPKIAQWTNWQDSDAFRFTADSDSVQLSVRKADGSAFTGQFFLLDANGTLLGNANQTQFSGLTSGAEYTILLVPQTEGQNERCVLSVSSLDTQPKAVSDVASGTQLSAPLSSVTLQLSENADLSRLCSADALRVVSTQDPSVTLTPSGIRILEGNQVEFTFSTPISDGLWTLQLDDSALFSISGSAFTLAETVFSIDSTPAEIVDFVVGKTDGKPNGTVTITFSESIANAQIELTGMLNDSVSFTKAELSGNVLTLQYDAAALPSDVYTIRLFRFWDLAGNLTEVTDETGSRTFGITAPVTSTPAPLPESAWNRDVTDGSFAFTAYLNGYVENGAPIQFQITLRPGETLDFRYPKNEFGSGITASWEVISSDASGITGIVTVSANGNGTLGDPGSNGAVFVLTLLRNTQDEVSEETASSSGMELTFSTITEHSADTAEPSSSDPIRQASVTGKLTDAGELDSYRFTASASAQISAAVMGISGNEFVLRLYELQDGIKTKIAEGTSFDTMSAWLQNIGNTANAPIEYILEVSSAADAISGTGEYRLVVTENAVFNGTTNSTMENALSLDKNASAVGHVSSEQITMIPSDTRQAMSGNSIAANDRFLFVGVPGDSENADLAGKVIVYEFNGLIWEEIATLKANDSAEGDLFGTTLALDGNTLAVSAVNTQNANGTQGAVYLFTIEPNGTFTQSMKILNPTANTDFGSVMDYADGLLVTGTQNIGSIAYVFKITGNSYQTYPLDQFLDVLNLDTQNTGTRNWPALGYSAAVNGDLIVLGAPGTENFQLNETLYESSGAAFIFRMTENGLSLVQVIQTSDPSDTLLGFSVAADGGIVTALASSSSGNVLYTTDLNELNTRTILPEQTETSYFYEKTLTFENGILSVAGQSKENLAFTMKLQEDGSWMRLNTSQLEVLENSSLTNISFGFDSAWTNGTHFVSDPNAFLYTMTAGMIHSFDHQSDFYRFTTEGTSISVRLTPSKKAASDSEPSITAQVLDKAGKSFTGTYADGVWQFSGLDSGTEYFLKLTAAENSAVDYAMTVEGIVQAENTLSAETFEIFTASGAADISQTLDGRITKVTLTFGNEALRADRLSAASVSLFNGKEWVNADACQLSSDLHSVTFTFGSGLTLFTAEPKLQIAALDFCTLEGAVLKLADLAAGETAEFQLNVSETSVTQKMKASTGSVQMTWNFGQEVSAGQNSWADAVSIRFTSAEGGPQEDVTNSGRFTYADGILTWTWNETPATGDQFSVFLDASLLRTVSGSPFAGLEELEDGAWGLKKEFTVNLDASMQTQLIVRKTSSIAEADGIPKTAPESEGWAHEWNTVWVELWGSVQSVSEYGIVRYEAQITYDPALFSPFDAQGNAVFQFDSALFSSVSVTKVEGRNVLQIQATAHANIENAGAADLEGNGSQALIASIRFAPAGKSGVANIYANGDYVPTPMGTAFVENSISVEASNGALLTENAQETPDIMPNVYPVIYDLNDDGQITITDLVRFAKNYGRSSQSTAPDLWNSAALCDFDQNGKIDITDLVQFAKNYGRNINSTQEISFKSQLTQDWGPVSLTDAALNVSEVLAVTENAGLMQTSGISEYGTATISTADPLPALTPEPVESTAVSEARPVKFNSFDTNVARTDWTALLPYLQEETNTHVSANTAEVLNAPQLLDKIFAEKEEETDGFQFVFDSPEKIQVLSMTDAKTDSKLLDSIFAEED